jgi:hypothetical protein
LTTSTDCTSSRRPPTVMPSNRQQHQA